MTDKKVHILKEPHMVLDEYCRWIGFVSRGVNDGIENGRRRKKHIQKRIF
jgi:hypothetical protein